MEELIDLIATESSPTDVTSKIKEVLFSKASERIDSLRPEISKSMFDDVSTSGEEE
jgi:hypothetical protein